MKHQSLACQFFIVSSFNWQTSERSSTDCVWRWHQTLFWGHRHPGHTQIQSFFHQASCSLIDCLSFWELFILWQQILEMKQRMRLREHPYLCLCATGMNSPMSECVTFPSALLCVQEPVHFFDMFCQPSLLTSQGIVGEFFATVKTREKKCISVINYSWDCCCFWAWIVHISTV